MKSHLTRGLRLCNPGNIRASKEVFAGEIKSSDCCFKRFQNIVWGYRAMFVILKTYVHKYKCDTPYAIVNRWAPPIENNVSSYTRAVCAFSGLNPFEKIELCETRKMKNIVYAIAKEEQGVEPDRAMIDKAWTMFYNTYKAVI
jgi:hypothetical protein